MVTAAAAQAAVATVQAAGEVMRLASPSKSAKKYYNAAVVIQTAFRGYLVIVSIYALLIKKGFNRLYALKKASRSAESKLNPIF